MSKSINITLSLALALFLGMAGIAMAADVTNLEFDGDVAIEGKAKTMVDATARLVIPSGEAVEYVQTNVVGDGLAPVCHNIKDKSEGTHFVDLDLKMPPEIDFYDVDVDLFGIFGVFTSNGCDFDNHVGSAGFSDVLRVVESGVSTPTSGSSSFLALSARLDALEGLMDELFDRLDDLFGGGAPGAPVANPVLQWSYLSIGSTGPAVSALQSYLISNGFSIPAIQWGGAAYGYYGEQTANAYSQAVNSQ